jgi:transcriptional regulator with PAS, ATPase and Fis domain
MENRLSFKELVISNLQHYRLFQDELTPDNARFSLTFEFRTASGGGKWVSDDGLILFNKNGRVCGSMGIFVDISAQKAQELSIQAENLRLKTALRSPARLGGMVGQSPPMQEVFSRILKLALSTTHLVVLGESGTGKELAARAIHDLSNRSAAAFVPVNCSSISESLFESEFFGYLKGAFTGADSDHQGYMDTAHRGTLFLDEVGDIPLNMQTKLLRVLDGYGYLPVGGRVERYSDFRLISATNHNLEQLLQKGLMRKDFYYRINAVNLHLPPLRERRGDIPILVDHFLHRQRLSRHDLPPEFLERLCAYSWPGNIRELQNALSRYMAFQDMDLASRQIFEPAVAPAAAPGLQDGSAPPRAGNYEEFERGRLLEALSLHDWRPEEAAARLGWSRSTIYRKMRKYSLLKR